MTFAPRSAETIMLEDTCVTLDQSVSLLQHQPGLRKHPEHDIKLLKGRPSAAVWCYFMMNLRPHQSSQQKSNTSVNYDYRTNAVLVQDQTPGTLPTASRLVSKAPCRSSLSKNGHALGWLGSRCMTLVQFSFRSLCC